jgi:hypothetical protein
MAGCGAVSQSLRDTEWVDGDGDIDLLVREQPRLIFVDLEFPVPITRKPKVAPFALLQESARAFSLRTNLTGLNTIQRQPTSIKLRTIDANLDGNMDAMLNGVQQVINGADDQIVFVGSTAGERQTPARIKALDATLRSFASETNGWLKDPNYFFNTAKDARFDPAQLVKKAISAGIPRRLAYQLALLSARPAPTSYPDREYWRPSVERMRRRHALEADADDTARRILLQSFGPSARERAEFSPVFNTHSDGFDFLSADKRLALNDILANPPNAGTVQPGSASVPCAMGACGEAASRIRELLTPEEYFEHQLRESTLAAYLSNSGIDFSEREFRRVYRILAKVGATPASIKATCSIQR